MCDRRRERERERERKSEINRLKRGVKEMRERERKTLTGIISSLIKSRVCERQGEREI